MATTTTTFANKRMKNEEDDDDVQSSSGSERSQGNDYDENSQSSEDELDKEKSKRDNSGQLIPQLPEEKAQYIAFTCNEKTLSALFTEQYVVPYFQRSYQWDAVRTVKLVQDLESCFRSSDPSKYSREEAKDELRRYFLGHAVTSQAKRKPEATQLGKKNGVKLPGEQNKEYVEEDSGEGENITKREHILDGQQRITTMILILVALRQIVFDISALDDEIQRQDALIKKLDEAVATRTTSTSFRTKKEENEEVGCYRVEPRVLMRPSLRCFYEKEILQHSRFSETITKGKGGERKQLVAINYDQVMSERFEALVKNDLDENDLPTESARKLRRNLKAAYEYMIRPKPSVGEDPGGIGNSSISVLEDFCVFLLKRVVVMVTNFANADNLQMRAEFTRINKNSLPLSDEELVKCQLLGKYHDNDSRINFGKLERRWEEMEHRLSRFPFVRGKLSGYQSVFPVFSLLKRANANWVADFADILNSQNIETSLVDFIHAAEAYIKILECRCGTDEQYRQHALYKEIDSYLKILVFAPGSLDHWQVFAVYLLIHLEQSPESEKERVLTITRDAFRMLVVQMVKLCWTKKQVFRPADHLRNSLKHFVSSFGAGDGELLKRLEHAFALKENELLPSKAPPKKQGQKKKETPKEKKKRDENHLSSAPSITTGNILVKQKPTCEKILFLLLIANYQLAIEEKTMDFDFLPEDFMFRSWHSKDLRTFTLEHIFPENIDGDNWNNESKNIAPLLNDFGNLTILEWGVNKMVLNKGPLVKHEGYQKSKFPVARKLSKEVKTWSPAQVDEGAKRVRKWLTLFCGIQETPLAEKIEG